MKPLIIGEAPSKNGKPERPIEGRIGQRLADHAGLSYADFLVHFDRVNLLHERQEVAGKGFVFDRAAAINAAQALVKQLTAGRLVLLLGRRVAGAFGCTKDYFDAHHLENGAILYVVPHPSGINRWWNDPWNSKTMRAFMHQIVKWTR
jgi:hypothetical protein